MTDRLRDDLRRTAHAHGITYGVCTPGFNTAILTPNERELEDSILRFMRLAVERTTHTVTDLLEEVSHRSGRPGEWPLFLGMRESQAYDSVADDLAAGRLP